MILVKLEVHAAYQILMAKMMPVIDVILIVTKSIGYLTSAVESLQFRGVCFFDRFVFLNDDGLQRSVFLRIERRCAFAFNLFFCYGSIAHCEILFTL